MLLSIGSTSRWRGERLPVASAISHALSSRGAEYLCESLSTASAALNPCSSNSTDWNIRSTTPAHDGPTLSAQRQIRPASQSEYDPPSGRSASCVEYLLRAYAGNSGWVASRSPPRKTSTVDSVTRRSTVLPTARWVTE